MRKAGIVPSCMDWYKRFLPIPKSPLLSAESVHPGNLSVYEHIKGLQAGKNSSIITNKKGGGRMSTAKKLIIDNLSNIPDDIQDEFEVMENLYKLLRFRKSQRSVAENGGYTTDEVRKMFQEKHEERTILA